METAHKTDEEKKEYFDSEEDLNIKIDKLAQWIKVSSHFVAFTGAGISTAAGIKDYRSGVNTVLKVGPGVWEKKKLKIKDKKKTDTKQLMQKTFPTITHLALASLMQRNYLKFIISQNVDSLHIKSGIPNDKIIELHGNTNLETCIKCKKKYYRDYKVRNNSNVHDHKTGRKCFECKSYLIDSIINFNENLKEENIDRAWDEAQKSDLMLCLGSSLRITPAADLPYETLKNGGKIVIVNLQKTPLNVDASLCIYAKIEDVIERLMVIMNIEVPLWTFYRKIAFKWDRLSKEFTILTMHTFTDDYFSFLKKIEIKYLDKNFSLIKEPFSYKFNELIKNNDIIQLKFNFEANYGEPNFTINEKFEDIINKILIIQYYPFDKKWVKSILCDDMDKLKYVFENLNI